MSNQIENIASGVVFTTASPPVLVNGIWECGDRRFTDPTGTLYQVVSVTTAYVSNFVDIPTFKLLFTPAEEVAIYASTDPQVIRFVALVDDPKTTALDLNLPAVIERVTYLSTLAATTPPSALPISSTRLAQVLSGALQ